MVVNRAYTFNRVEDDREEGSDKNNEDGWQTSDTEPKDDKR